MKIPLFLVLSILLLMICSCGKDEKSHSATDYHQSGKKQEESSKPANSEPVETKTPEIPETPKISETVEIMPIKTAPAEIEPVKTRPAKIEPVEETRPIKTEPISNPVKTELPKPEPENIADASSKNGGLLKGLSNLGASCFLNSMFSILLNFPDWRPYERNSRDEASESLNEILENLNHLKNEEGLGSVDYNNMRNIISGVKYLFYKGRQEDPMEAVLSALPLITNLHTVTTIQRNYTPQDKYIGPIHYLPVGEWSSDQNTQVEDVSFLVIHQRTINDTTISHATLSDAINESYFHERIDLVDEAIPLMKHKNTTHLTGEAPKYILGQILIYDYNKKTYLASKITDNLSLSEQVEIPFYSNDQKFNNVKYNLVASINHIGNSANSGHYISYIRHENGWYMHNDSHVSLVGNMNQILNAGNFYDHKADGPYPYMILLKRSDVI